MLNVGILGASGFTGVELLRLCAVHPHFNVTYATGDTQAGTLARSLYPSLSANYPNLVFEEFTLEKALQCDVLFLALPHEASLELVPQLYKKVKLVLVAAGVIQAEGVIVDAASGVSGAGRAAKSSNSFNTVNEDFAAYGLLDHRHTPEIEQVTGAQILFTPHLAPMNRGIFATCYAKPVPQSSPTSASLVAVLARAFANESFVVVGQQIPSTKATLGTNVTQLTARFDERTGYVVVLAALDNLTKGASGGAVQAANVALGLPEESGLAKVGMFP